MLFFSVNPIEGEKYKAYEKRMRQYSKFLKLCLDNISKIYYYELLFKSLNVGTYFTFPYII